MARVLGEKIDAPKTYSPEVLEAIPRATGRSALDMEGIALHGADVWHLYELSWLDSASVPHQHVGVLTIPVDSPCTVESKSLKLYCNGLNFHSFPSIDAAIAVIREDIARVVGSEVSLDVLAPSAIAMITREPHGQVLDAVTLGSDESASESADWVEWDAVLHQVYVSHGLRSLCPVTAQPDWGTLEISILGPKANEARLLDYIHGYREHQEFHEQCIERIYRDLMIAFAPEVLTVTGFYQRRGGIDITPWRSNHPLVAPPDRMGRQ